MSALEKSRGKGPARGYSWPPFEPGNQAAVTHGAKSMLLLRPRAAELADRLRAALGDSWDERYGPAVEAAALAAARVERAAGFLLSEDLDEETIHERYAELDNRAKGWLRLYLTTLERLGLTPRVEAEAAGPTTLVLVSAFGGHETVIDSNAVEVAEVAEVGAAPHPPAEGDDRSHVPPSVPVRVPLHASSAAPSPPDATQPETQPPTSPDPSQRQGADGSGPYGEAVEEADRG